MKRLPFLMFLSAAVFSCSDDAGNNTPNTSNDASSDAAADTVTQSDVGTDPTNAVDATGDQSNQTDADTSSQPDLVALPGTVVVPQGTYSIGCFGPDCGVDEMPVHDVNLTGFLIGTTAVPQGEYQTCVDAGDCLVPGNNPDYDPVAAPLLPVTGMTWQQANDYCAFAGGRLPTEVEWEAACRGPNGQMFPWGDEPADCTKANVLGCQPDNAQVAVTDYSDVDSPFGTVQMVGNVWEWTSDWYGEDAYENHAPNDPVGPPTGERHVTRGGSSGNGGGLGRCPNRAESYSDEFGGSGLGFRCAFDAN